MYEKIVAKTAFLAPTHLRAATTRFLEAFHHLFDWIESIDRHIPVSADAQWYFPYLSI